MLPEKRYSARYDVLLIVEFRPLNSTTAYAQGVTENISPEGLSFDSANHDSRVTDILELQLKTPHGDLSLSITGEIIWKRELWYKCVTGIKFRDIDRDTEGKIAELVVAAREKHAGASVDTREGKGAGMHKEEKRHAAVPDSGQGRELQGAAVKEDNDAASTILESIDKVIDKAESEHKRKTGETDNIQVRDLKRKENKDETLQISGKPVTFSRASVKDKGRGKRDRLFMSLGAVCMIAALAVLSVTFAPVRQLFITDTSTVDSVSPQDTPEGHTESPAGDISHEGMTTPAEPEQKQEQEIPDVNNELPEEAKAGDTEPVPDSRSISPEEQEGAQPLTTAVQPDRSPPSEGSLLISKLEVTITFDKNSAVINPWFYPEIDKISNTLFNYPGAKVKVTGHTDSVGLTSYNMDLSVRRAAAARDLLVQKGIERSRIEVIGLGYSRPANSNDTESGRTRNRRVEITIIP